jgi:hypothetical protein
MPGAVRPATSCSKHCDPNWTPWARRCGKGIPAEIRDGTVFTVDAIVDTSNAIWALEMNSNPFLHPAVYELMLRSLLPATSRTEASQVLMPV